MLVYTTVIYTDYIYTSDDSSQCVSFEIMCLVALNGKHFSNKCLDSCVQKHLKSKTLPAYLFCDIAKEFQLQTSADTLAVVLAFKG